MKKIITNLCLLVLASCSGQNNANHNSQVLATVNGDEITAFALQSELKGAQQNQSDQDAAKKLLAGLIDRQLLVQEAIKLDLERAPEVVQAVESAKAKIYAQAYLSKKLAKIATASESDINTYIDSHPEKFRHRKVFKMQDVVFSNDVASLDLASLEKDAVTLQDVQAALDAKGIHYETGSSQFVTDRLPEPVLSKIKSMKKGDLLFLHNHNNIIVKSIDDITEQPMSAEHAHLLAERLLNQQKQQAYIAQEVARLKALSSIEVVDAELNKP